MVKKIRICTMFSLMSFAILTLTSCGGGSDSSDYVYHKLNNIDISGASSIFIAESADSSSVAAAASKEKRIFKITTDGIIMEVTFIDSMGRTFTYQKEPTDVYDVNPEWLIIRFNDNLYPGYIGFLVNKNDGAVYELNNPPHVNGYTFRNAKSIQFDADGNFYYVNYGYNQDGAAVYKINASDKSNITEERVTPDTDNALSFFVNSQGHVYYSYVAPLWGNRIRMSNGGLFNLPPDSGLSVWINLNGNISYLFGGVLNVVIDENYNVSTISNPDPNEVCSFTDGTGYLVQFSNRTLMVEQGNNPRILEVENPSNTPREIILPQISEIKDVVFSDRYYYLSGLAPDFSPILLRVDPVDDSSTVLLPNNGDYFDVQSMAVSPEDEIILNALRMFDGVKVMGKIDSNGQLTILNETSSYSVTQIEMISHLQ